MKQLKKKKKKLKIETDEGEKISHEIISKTQQAFEKAGFTAERIAEELALVGFSDMANHVEINDDGSLLMKSIEEMGKHSRVIKKVKEKTVITESKDGSELYKTSQVEYELHDKLSALDKAIGIIGMKAPEKHDVNVNGSLMAAVVEVLTGEKNDAK